jgi:thymidine kinase
MAKLYFYYSAMNAGKSTTLLQSAWNYRERGLNPVILTPVADRDSGQPRVSSRIGISSAAHLFAADDDLFNLIDGMLDSASIHCVLVDEAQFLSKAQVHQLSDVVDDLNIPVLTYGLRTDFRGQLFPGSSELLAWADELVELKTICHTGRKATMVVRVDQHGYAITDGAQVEIGGNERYVSVSRREFKAIVHGGKQVKVIDQTRLDDGLQDADACEDDSVAAQQSLLG